MAQRNVLKATVPDRMVWLPKPACVSAAARLSKALKDAHSKGDKQSARPCCPLLKLLLIKISTVLTPCTSTQRKLENEQRKSYRILISSCWTTDILLFDFYRKRELGPDQSHYKQSRLWSRTQTTLAQITRITHKWIYTILKIFSSFTIFEQLALALRTELPWNFSLYWTCIFCYSGFLSNLRLPLKQSSSGIFHGIEYLFLIIQDFEQLALALKTEFALKFFKPAGGAPPDPRLVRLCLWIIFVPRKHNW